MAFMEEKPVLEMLMPDFTMAESLPAHKLYWYKVPGLQMLPYNLVPSGENSIPYAPYVHAIGGN